MSRQQGKIYLLGALVAVLSQALAADDARSLLETRAARSMSTDLPSNKIDPALLADIELHGNVSAIIRLHDSVDFATHGTDRERAEHVAKLQRQFENSMTLDLSSADYRVTRQYKYVPSLAVSLSAKALGAIATNPHVLSVRKGARGTTGLSNTVNVIDAKQVHNAGYRADGTSIAILDTGIQNEHPFTSDIVYEACFGTNDPPYQSDCDQQAEYDSGIGSAYPSSNHATHVAGIAAGHAAGVAFTGVAPGADLIDIKVLSFNTQNGFKQFREEEIIAALEEVYAVRDTYNVAAVNMSLQSEAVYQGACDGQYPETKAIVDALLAEGVVTVAINGNYGQAGIVFPGCLSNVVAVGAVHDNGAVWSYNNYHSSMSVFAPGVSVWSSSFGAGATPSYENMTGTSQAAPHVAGAAALLRAAHPSWSGTTIKNRLISFGRNISHAAGGFTKKLLDVQQAIALPEHPRVTAEFISCTWGQSNYYIAWDESDPIDATTWDVDISSNNSSWSSWYNGAETSKLLNFDGPKLYFRARGGNGTGWGPFYSIDVTDVCSGSGDDPEPNAL